MIFAWTFLQKEYFYRKIELKAHHVIQWPPDDVPNIYGMLKGKTVPMRGISLSVLHTLHIAGSNNQDNQNLSVTSLPIN